MRSTEFAEYIWSDKQSRYLLLKDKSINWTGHVALCKGPTTAQEQLEQEEANFYQVMTQDYSTTFAKNQAILANLTASLNPIVAAGPNQMGFNTAELNNLNSQALQGTGQSYAQASQAIREQQAATGGGNMYLPSGVQSQQEAGLASAAANQESSQLLGIQQAGYQQGYTQYENAVSQLGGVAGQYSPTQYSNSANSAGQAADAEANTIQQASQQGWNNFTGILSGAMGGAGTAIGGIWCWIAAELFGGWGDLRTHLVRIWLFEEFSKRWYGRLFNCWYGYYGQSVAKKIQTNRPMRWAFRKLFEWFLAQAKKAEEGACR